IVPADPRRPPRLHPRPHRPAVPPPPPLTGLVGRLAGHRHGPVRRPPHPPGVAAPPPQHRRARAGGVGLHPGPPALGSRPAAPAAPGRWPPIRPWAPSTAAGG